MTISGSHSTGKFTELAMKHFSCTGLWRVRASPTPLPAATVTVGRSTALFEPADTVSSHFHHSLGAIDIGGHDDPSFGGEVEIPELAASRERRHEQLFRVLAGAVSSKGRVGGALNGGLTIRANLIVAGTLSIARGAAAEVTGPGERHCIAMLARICHDSLREITLPSGR